MGSSDGEGTEAGSAGLHLHRGIYQGETSYFTEARHAVSITIDVSRGDTRTVTPQLPMCDNGRKCSV